MIALFLKRCLWVLLPVIGLLWGINRTADTGFRRCRLWEYGVWNDIYAGRINADLLIMGASRAVAQVSPVILDSVLGTSSYNIGITAWRFRMEYARLKVYLQHNRKPRTIVEVLDNATLSDRRDLIGYNQFYPYLWDPLIREAVRGYEGEPTFLECHVPFLTYARNPIHAAEGCAEYVKSLLNIPETDRVKGYCGQAASWDGSSDQEIRGRPLHSVELPTDPATLGAFDDFLRYCRTSHIRVILLYTPEYQSMIPYYKNREAIFSLYNAYASTYHIPFLDYSWDTLGRSQRYYYNAQHLNKTGAEIFSRQLADTLKYLVP